MRNNQKLLPFLVLLYGVFCQIHPLFAQISPKADKKTTIDSLLISKQALKMPPYQPKAPIEKLLIDSIPDPTQLSNEQIVIYAGQLVDRALYLENGFIQNAQRTVYMRQLREQDLKIAKNEKNTPDSVLKSLKISLKGLKNLESASEKLKKQSEKVASLALEISEMDTADMRKNIVKLRGKVADLAARMGQNTEILVAFEKNEPLPQAVKLSPAMYVHEPDAAAKTDSAPPVKEEEKKKKKKSKKQKEPVEPEPDELLVPVAITTGPAAPEKPLETTLTQPLMVTTEKLETAVPLDSQATDVPKKNKKGKVSEKNAYKSYDPSADVMLNPPQPPCIIPVRIKDEFNGETRIETQKQEFFRFTNSLLKQYYKDAPHILCEANILSTGGSLSLNLVFTIRDQNAKRAFGGLAKGSTAVLKLMDGTTLNLICQRNDEGSTDESKKITVFKGNFAIDKTALKKLSKTEVDKLRVAWNVGYEDYEIYNVDLLKHQINCLEQ